MNDKQERHDCRGFTLVEILVVVVILGLLATIVTFKTTTYVGKTRVQTTRATIANILTAINAYEMEIGKYPPDLNDLVKEGDEKWPGPFLDSTEVPKDGWGNSFDYKIVGKRVRVTSSGPDGQLGNEDALWNN